MATTIEIIGRRWADETGTKEIVKYRDPKNPGECYETLPCPNTVTGEQQAIQAHINYRKGKKLEDGSQMDYAGQPPPVSTDTVSVSV